MEEDRCKPLSRTEGVHDTSDLDARLLAAIDGVSLCDRCIASKIGVTKAAVAAALTELTQRVRIESQTGRCAECRRPDLLRKIA